MESVGTYIAEMLIRIGIFQKSSIDTIYSILKSNKRSSVKTIFKAIVKDNSPNLKIHIVLQEVKNTIEKSLLQTGKPAKGWTHFLYYTASRQSLVMTMTPQEKY